MSDRLSLVILGLSITSSWGNGHATTYRALVREMTARGHDVLFLERDQPWYAENRDMPVPPHGRTVVYRSVDELRDRFAGDIRHADAVILGSYVPDGIAIGDWLAAEGTQHDGFLRHRHARSRWRRSSRGRAITSPRARLRRSTCTCRSPAGPTLTRLEQEFGSPAARALYCSFDPELYYPEVAADVRWDLGYLGTYSDDRQPTLDRLLLEPARQWREGRFMVAGPQYPDSIRWPANVEREIHISPAHHRTFYTAQRFTLNVTRTAMIRAGWSPSVRLFEAAACGVPIISDEWPGLEEFLVPGREIFVSRSGGRDACVAADAAGGGASRSRGACPTARDVDAHGRPSRSGARGLPARRPRRATPRHGSWPVEPES